MALIGGTATMYGPIIAAFGLTFATEALAGFRGMEETCFVVVAIGMILILRFAHHSGRIAQSADRDVPKPVLNYRSQFLPIHPATDAEV